MTPAHTKWVSASILGLAAALATAVRAESPALQSQPANEQTVLSIIVLEFSPESPPVSLRQIRRTLDGATPHSNPVKRLADLGQAEVLSRPNLLVTGSQEVAITVGERLPVKSRRLAVPDDADDRKEVPGQDAGGQAELEYQNVGLTLTLQTEWLRIDPQRAYARVAIDRTYLTRGEDDGALPEPSITHQEYHKERVLTEGRMSWLLLPVGTDKATDARLIIGLSAHRVRTGSDPAPRQAVDEHVIAD